MVKRRRRRKPESDWYIPKYAASPNVFRIQVCRTVNKLRLVHGWTAAECARLYDIPVGRLKKWMTAQYRWEREARREWEIAESRFSKSMGAKLGPAQRTRKLRDVRRAMMRGCTLTEACREGRIDRNSVAHWLLGDAFEQLVREALIAERPVRKRRVEVPQEPQKWRDMALQTWLLDEGDMRRRASREIAERTKRLADELKGAYELNAAQRKSLELAVRHETMADRALTRAEGLYNYELAGVPGAAQAGYAWERMFIYHAEHQRRALRDAGLLEALAEMPERSTVKKDRFQVVIPEN